MNAEAETIATMQWGLHKLAESIGDPEAARRLAEIADRLNPKPGPSKARRLSKAEQARRVRHVWRLLYRNETQSNAARLMAISASRYESSAWQRDLEAGREPATEPNQTWRALLDTEGKVPSERTIRRWLARKAT